MSKRKPFVVLNNCKLMKLAILLVLFVYLLPKAYADDGTKPDSVPPNTYLGIADLNTGPEAGHLYPNGNYHDWFQANYDQTENIGVQWNRWEVIWPRVENDEDPNVPPDYNDYDWSCVWNGIGTAPEECPNDGDRYDYLRLAQEEEARGVQSLVLFTGIPELYENDSGGPKILGLFENVFMTTAGTTTNDPSNPNINLANPINANNRWANFFYHATVRLGDLGVHHWQIMNELNDNTYWANGGEDDYVRVLEVSSRILQYRQLHGQALEDQIVLGGLIYKLSPNTQEWTDDMLEELADRLNQTSNAFTFDFLALHTYDRNRTSYNYPDAIYNYLEGLDNQYQVNISTKLLWLTETGSSSCADEIISGNCPPMEGGEARSTDEEQSHYIIQSIAYAQSLPQLDKYFQFHLHEGCPHGTGEQTGFGLFHNWEFYHNVFVGSSTACAIEPHDGREKPAYQAFSQSSRWLRDFNGYSEPFGNNIPAEFLIFPVANSQRTYVAWSRVSDEIELIFYPSSELSGGPILVISPDGTTEILNRDGNGRYVLRLPEATNPIEAQEDGQLIIGGKPFIILEHLLFDLGTKPSIFNPQEGWAKIQFGLNLPADIISKDTVEIVIYDETDTVVWTNSDVFSNGERYFIWDGLDTQTNDPVANGLYRYEISLPNQGDYSITGVVGVSQPGVLACFFNTSAPDPHPPSPNEAFIDYRGSETYSEMSFYWDDTPPIPELADNDNWIARYVSYLQVEDEGMYQLRMGDTDDVARLFVDGALIRMPDWTINEEGAMDLDSPEIYLSRGLHTIVTEHAQVTGSASLTLQWKQENWWFWWPVDMLWQPGGDLADVCEATNGSPVLGPFLNGDFEDGLDHWTLEIHPPDPGIWVLTSVAHSGLYGVEGYIHSAGFGLRSDLFAVTDNSCQIVSLYLKEVSEDYGDWLFEAHLRWYDEQGLPMGTANPITVSSEVMPTQWQMVTGNVQVPNGVDSAELILELRGADTDYVWEGANYTMRVDDVLIDDCP